MSTDAETATAETFTMDALAPADLLMDANARTGAEATVTKEFIGTFREHAKSHPLGCGNYTPVTLVRRPDGQLRVRTGHRRVLACAAAGAFVLGFIAGDEGDEQADRRARLIEQFNENVHREGMTRSDEAQLVLDLFGENMTDAGIAKALGLRGGKATAAAYRAIAGSETARQAADRWKSATLGQLAVTAEFEGDEEALDLLEKVATGNPGQFDHVAQQLRDSAAERAQKAALTVELEAAGYQVTDSHDGLYRNGWATVANYYNDDTGKEPITTESHATCPHRAVRIVLDSVWPAEAEAAYREAHGLAPDDGIEFGEDEDETALGYVDRWVFGQDYCTDPDAAGHVYKYGGHDSGSPKPEPGSAAAEKAKEARRHVLAGNKLWRSATVTRLGHVKALLSRKELKPKALETSALLLIAEAVARGETQPEMGSGHDLACELLGLPASGRDAIVAALSTAAPARRVVVTLAMVLAAAEGKDKSWGTCANVQTWQQAETGGRYYNSDSKPGRYLTWLETHTGYALTDLEVVVARGKPKAGKAAAAGESDAPGPGTSDPAQSPQDAARPGTGDLSAVIAAAPGGVDTGHGTADAFDIISGNATDAELAAAEGTCRGCGCTDAMACPGGCTWVEPGLCSTCAGPPVGPVVDGEDGGQYEIDPADIAGPDNEAADEIIDARYDRVMDEMADDQGYAGDDAESSR